jgi:hypothetical protein
MTQHESSILRDIEYAFCHYGFCVLPRNARASTERDWSIWNLVEPGHVGVVWRENTGCARYGRRFVRYGMSGAADYSGWLFRSGQRIEIECKGPKGALTPDQAAHLALARKTGVICGVARSYSDMENIFNEFGIERRT